VLGRVALRDRDKAGAKEHLLAAGHVAKGATVSSFGPNMRLARELLLAGERGVVLQYLRLCAQFWPSGEDELRLWTAAVEEGRIPDFGANLDY
jgi:hypothetical protein